MSLIQLQAGCLAFGHVPLLDDVDLNIDSRERVCLIGRNGTGKSTLLNVLAGEQTLDSGQVWRRDGIRIARLAQEVPGTADETLFEVVSQGLGDHSKLLARYHQASLTLAEDDVDAETLDAFGRLQHEVESAGIFEGSQRIDAVLSRLNLPPDDRMSESSGGVRRRAMLGQALVSAPDLLLLDEPTNHLDIEAIESLEEALLDYQGTVVFITHDRSLIDHLATRIIELDRGRLESFPGSYAKYLSRKSALLSAEADGDRKFDKALAEEEVWIRQGIKARRTRNEGRVRRLEAMRRERAERRARQGNAKMALASEDASGKLVIEAENVSFAYADGTEIIHDFSTLITRGDRIGIIGRNGSGKSTLLKLMLGELSPTGGSIRLGTRLQIAYFDQERAQLNSERSVRDNLADGSDHIEVGDKRRHVIGYLSDFLFPPARANSPVKTLSGGERNRLLLAKLFARPANLLVLDEPTNDLDVETLELLEELLGDYQGTLLLVSHDRSFLDQTVTSTIRISEDGHIEEHVGGYSDWQRHHAEIENRVEKPNGKAPSPAVRLDATDTPAQKKAGGKRRLSYKDKRELDSLPELIESLEARQSEVQQAIADPEFYKGEQAGVAAAMAELADLDVKLRAAYARWEEIEALQEGD